LKIEAGLAQNPAPAAQVAAKRPAHQSRKWSDPKRTNTARS